MFEALKIARLLIQLLPIIHTAIDQVEQLLPQSGQGAQKLEMVKSILEKAMEMEHGSESVFGLIWPTVSGLIANFVTIKNSIAG